MTDWGLSKKAFWDVRFEEIDFENHVRFVIEKVFNHGNWADQIAVMNYYGLERLKKEVVSIPYLRPTVVSFLSALLQIPKEEFRCSITKPLNQLHWDY
jgi:hypothetical protein